MISDHPIIKKIAWTSGTRRAGASMETHREYVGYLDEWDETERLTDEEIVRCGDCRWRKGVVCGYFDKITWVMDFCSHGTRRTE